MTAVEVFQFPTTGQPVRTVLRDGEPWFVARDVAAVLAIADAKSSVRLLDDDEKGVHSVHTPGGPQDVAVVNEPGLYSLILRSRKPEARAFKRWVTHEVLPAIRRTGRYEVAHQLPQSFAEALQLAADQARELEAARPKVEAHDAFMTADGALSFSEVAKTLAIPSMGRNNLIAALRDLGVLIPGTREPYQRYAHHFQVVSQSYEARDERRPTTTTYVKPTGVEFIRRLLAERWGVLS